MQDIELFNFGVFDSRVHFPERKRTAWRTVARYEIDQYCEDGGIAYINGDVHPIKKGDLLFARPGDRRRSDLHFTAQFLHFRTSDKRLIALLDALPHYCNGLDLALLQGYIKEIEGQDNSQNGFENLHATALLLELLYRLYKIQENESAEAFQSQKQSILKAAKSYMENHLSEELDVPTVAAVCNVSVSYLHKLFHQHLNMGPHGYLRHLRLSAAEVLLRTTDLPLSTIAEECGFTSQSYFTECFKRHRKIAPLVYRQQYAYPEE